MKSITPYVESKPPRQALVADPHGLDGPSRDFVVETLHSALTPLIPTLDVADSLFADECMTHYRAANKLLSILKGRKKPPATLFAPLKRAKYGRRLRRRLDEKSLRMAEDAIVLSVLPFIPTRDVAHAFYRDDWLLADALQLIAFRLRDAEKVAKKEKRKGTRHAS